MFAKMRSIRTWSLNRLKILFTFRAFKIFFYKKNPKAGVFFIKENNQYLFNNNDQIFRNTPKFISINYN